MKNYKAKQQSGMTLIELAVVLVILVGLAGLLIPYVSSFITKTHSATSGQTIAALNMAVNRYTNESFGDGGYPDDLDCLILDTADTVVGIADGSQYNKEALDVDSTTSLTSIGLNTCLDQLDGDVNFGASPTQRTFADTVEVVTLTGTGRNNLATALGIDTTSDAYVVLGVGNGSELSGRVINESPVHFHTGAADYDAMYSRFLAIFRVPSTTNALADANGNGAKFLGIVGPMNPIEGIGGHIQEYREVVRNENS